MISMIKVGLKKTDRSPRYFQFFIFNLCLFSPHLTLFHFLLHCFYPKILDQEYFRHCKTLHMRDFTQPQQKYAGTGENCNITITVIFYPGIKTVQKSHKLLDFKTIFNIFAKMFSALKFNI